jgi:hypothetical protein
LFSTVLLNSSPMNPTMRSRSSASSRLPPIASPSAFTSSMARTDSSHAGRLGFRVAPAAPGSSEEAGEGSGAGPSSVAPGVWPEAAGDGVGSCGAEAPGLADAAGVPDGVTTADAVGAASVGAGFAVVLLVGVIVGGAVAGAVGFTVGWTVGATVGCGAGDAVVAGGAVGAGVGVGWTRIADVTRYSSRSCALSAMLPLIRQMPTVSAATVSGFPRLATFATYAATPLSSPQTSPWRAFIHARDSASSGGAPKIAESV